MFYFVREIRFSEVGSANHSYTCHPTLQQHVTTPLTPPLPPRSVLAVKPSRAGRKLRERLIVFLKTRRKVPCATVLVLFHSVLKHTSLRYGIVFHFYLKMESEEARIRTLLASVEREEVLTNVPRTTGTFVRELFPDENIAETAVDAGDEDDELGQELPDNQLGEGEVDDLPGEQPEEAIDDDDFDDLECIPIKERQSANIVNRQNGRAAYISKSRKMLWDLQPKENTNIRAPNRNILRMRMGCVARTAKEAKTPLDVWNLFFNDATIISITNCTNIYINENKEKFARERDCKPTNPTEIRAFIGILYMAGVMRSSHHILEDLWETDGTGVEFFRCVMSLSRFKFVMRCMRFDDITTREERQQVDKLAPIRDLFDDFVEICKIHFVVSEFVTVDEMLEAFRGRCSFRQYIRNKPAKYGIKVYAMVCAKTFYTANLEVYVGKQPEGPYVVDNSAKEVVLRMIEPISGSGRNVTVDNFFTSVPLCEELTKDHRLTLVGTVRKNKREIPCTFLATKDRPVGSSSFAFKKDMTMVSYKTKKNKDVILLSSMHDRDDVCRDEESRNYNKPDIVLFYNTSKGGVDTVDKYKESYSTARISNRWSMRLFYTLLDIGCLNSFIILKKNVNEPLIRRKFIKELAIALCKDYGQQRLSYRNIPKAMKLRISEILGIDQQQQLRADPPADEVTSGRCHICNWKKNRPSKTRCIECRFFICREHSAVKCTNCNGNEDMEVE